MALTGFSQILADGGTSDSTSGFIQAPTSSTGTSSLMDVLINPTPSITDNPQYASDKSYVDAYGNPISDAQYLNPQAAQESAWNTARGTRQTGINSIYGSANDAASNLQGRFGNSVIDNLRVLTQGQDAINMKAQNNEASRTQGVNGILGMVGRGIQSGGRYLGNRNAGSSSAAGEIARAYGDIGRRQMSAVGNQYEQNNNQIMQDQSNQDFNVGKTKRDFSTSLNESVNGIVESARMQLADLDAAGANASLPDRIAIDQEKQNIKSQVLAKLQQYDLQLASGADQIKARDRQGNMVAANDQLAAGQAPEGSFQYTDQAPAQFQNTGPFSTGLPIFTNPIKRQLA